MKTSLKQNDFDRRTLKKGIEQTKSINRRKISRAIFIDRSPTVLRGGADLSTYPARSFEEIMLVYLEMRCPSTCIDVIQLRDQILIYTGRIKRYTCNIIILVLNGSITMILSSTEDI